MYRYILFYSFLFDYLSFDGTCMYVYNVQQLHIAPRIILFPKYALLSIQPQHSTDVAQVDII